MAKKDDTNMDELTAYYSNIYKELEDNTIADPYGSYILGRVKGGQKTVFSKSQTEIRNFDMSFLDTIESVYPAILKIMRDPKKSIRYEEEVVSVEKAKKVNSQTVRHLSSHTQLIKEITKEGDVIPSKVLTTYAEEELAIYENRFIKSLVKRMEMFLERRYEIMKVSLESFETQRFQMTNEFLMSGQMVTCNLDLAIKNDLTVNIETTKEQYNRLLHVRELVQGLKGTEFMRALAKARDVLPPIMKTNIIMHNADFKLCYGLWLYLDRVDGISNDVEVKEKSYRVSKTFENDMSAVMALALTSFIKNREIEGVYNSRTLSTIKAPKTQVRDDIELELNLSADNNKLEDYTMNEALLSQTARFFEAANDGMVRTGTPINESIRVVYRQMLDMLDQIYPLAFGVTDDELESKDLYEQLEFAKRKQMVIQIVRQQKQMNIARMGKEEKRVEKTIEKLNEKIKKQEEEERLRIEREHAREEALRLAAIARDEEIKARKRRIEDLAIERQKAIERRERDMLRATDNLPEDVRSRREHAIEFARLAREHLRDIHAEELREQERIRQEREAELQAERKKHAEFQAILDEVGLSEDEYNALEAEFGDLLDDEDFDPYNMDSFDERPKKKKKKTTIAPPIEELKEEPKEELKEEPKEEQVEATPETIDNQTDTNEDDEFASFASSLAEKPVEEEKNDLPSADSIPESVEDISDEELAALEAEYGEILDNLDEHGNLPIEDEAPADLDGPKHPVKLSKSLSSLDDDLESYDELLDSTEADVDAKGKKKKKKLKG